MRDRLNPRMREFVGRQEMFFLSTADAAGECDSSFRAGPAGFVVVLDDRTIAYPEYRGNGVHASLGNIKENPHVGILMVDFGRDRIGLHVNGRARLVSDEMMRIWRPELPVDPVPGRRPQIWVEVNIQEAYIHCSKHLPHLVKAPPPGASTRSLAADGGRAWGTDDVKRKGGDFFGAAAERRAARGRTPATPAPPPAAPVIPAPAAPAIPAPVASAASIPTAFVPSAASATSVPVAPVPSASVPLIPAQADRLSGTVMAAPAEAAAPAPAVADEPAEPALEPARSVQRVELLVRTERADRAVRAGLPDPEVWRRAAESALARAFERGQGGIPEPVPDRREGAPPSWFG